MFKLSSYLGRTPILEKLGMITDDENDKLHLSLGMMGTWTGCRLCLRVCEQSESVSTLSGGSFQIIHCGAQQGFNYSKNILMIPYLYFYMRGGPNTEFIY